jgi:hypothetical protein
MRTTLKRKPQSSLSIVATEVNVGKDDEHLKEGDAGKFWAVWGDLIGNQPQPVMILFSNILLHLRLRSFSRFQP